MYEERHSIFSVKKVILAILIIVLIFFVLMWLFPTKGYLNNNEESTSVTKVFSENINLMKEAAISYYTDERLPQNTGDKEKMTLADMIDKHLVTELVDSNNEICNNDKSYVEVTKEENEYLMKINLSCNDKADYINTHMGSYTYCVGDICEKKNKLVESEEAKEVNNEVSTDNTNNSTSTSNSSTCEYVKTIATYGNYGSWSGWTKTKVTASNTRNVETKVVREQTGINRKTYTTEARYAATKQTINGKTVYVCSSEYNNPGRYSSAVACKKTLKVYKDTPIYSDVTYYRYQDRSVNYQTVTKWASCNSNLVNQGYKKTGNSR